eukprot:s2809_g8.t1
MGPCSPHQDGGSLVGPLPMAHQLWLQGAMVSSDGMESWIPCFAGFDFYTQDKTTGVITPATCSSDGCQSTMLSWFFQWAFCTAGATIVSGAVAERVKSPTYAIFAFLMASFIYPVVVAWTWGGGWLATILDVGYMDFAGSGAWDVLPEFWVFNCI